ncbi:BMP family lipoprotein [Gottfriedia luciferensis]|uniref:BMP family lipoprotein n=1 Tax=Gottfriedia luciferensis TaxID=178774 RepID=UPI001ABF279E|nr:BMP family ABC transporter substrate-binding protein [Gottfriedia luciferensis]
MKKAGLVLSMALAAGTILGACGKGGETKDAKGAFKIGMVTDSGTIDDKSFNQGTWEGIQAGAKELGFDLKQDTKYLKPAGETEADYLKEIGNLNDAGYKVIITPGYKFETAINKAQDKYKDDKFVIIDGTPHTAKDFTPNVKKNTVSIFFAEHEAGYLAGVATALQLKTGDVGFIGGMEIPAVQKFNWGFQQGVKYANENLGTKISLKANNVVYSGSFTDKAAGQQIAAQMFDRGVKAIFCAAGGVGQGAITEAKNRVDSGKDAWIIGVDVDQYADGVYKDNKSVILTSATKGVSKAASDMVKAEKDKKFPGGETLTYDAKNDGIGLPKENPNLSPDTLTKVSEVLNKIKSGEIKVSNEKGNLIK